MVGFFDKKMVRPNGPDHSLFYFLPGVDIKVVARGSPVIDLAPVTEGGGDDGTLGGGVGEYDVAILIRNKTVSVDVTSGDPETTTGQDPLGVVSKFIAIPADDTVESQIP